MSIFAKKDNIAISGTGTIGMMIALVAQGKGANVTVIGRSDKSLEFSKSLGLKTLLKSVIVDTT